MPRHVPRPCPPAAALEGEYSSYSQAWVSAALAVALNDLCYGFIDITGKRVHLKGAMSRYAILNLDDGSILEEGASTQYSPVTLTLDASVTARYVVYALDATHIRIYKDGSLLQTLTLPAGVDVNSGGVCISYNGQFIVAYDYNARTVYCYEGS